jgi:protease-4
LVTVIGFIVFGALAPSGGGLGMGGHVGLVRAQGMISAETTGGMFGSVGVAPEPFLDELETALSSPACEAVVIRIDSPGGTAAASEEIYRGMLRLKQDYPGKPLIVSMGDVAASGGYYMACAADYIFANSATATGSIGVRSSFLSIEDLITEHGVEATNITSGEYKAMGSMYKDMTDDERAIFKHQVMLIYDDFVSAVAEGRGLPKADVRQVADGRVWLGGDAIDNGLIDEIGGLQEAVEHAGSQVGLSDPEVYDYSLMSLPFGSFLEASSEAMLRGGERYLLERGAAGGVKPFRLQMSGGPLGE